MILCLGVTEAHVGVYLNYLRKCLVLCVLHHLQYSETVNLPFSVTSLHSLSAYRSTMFVFQNYI